MCIFRQKKALISCKQITAMSISKYKLFKAAKAQLHLENFLPKSWIRKVVACLIFQKFTETSVSAKPIKFALINADVYSSAGVLA